MTQSTTGLKRTPRPALGRGLSALVSASAPAQSSAAPEATKDLPINTHQSSNLDTAQSTTYPQFQQPVDNQANPLNILPISQLRANPKQPRQDFSESEIAELTESIKTLGVLQPILVRPISSPPNTTYQVVAGERRYRAAIRAGLSQVPVIIKELNDQETLEIAIVENVQRQGLNPIEEALGYQKLIDEFSRTVQEVAERVGKDRTTVVNATRLLKLPETIQDMLRDGRIAVGHAKAILTVKEPNAQIGLANKIIAENLSVRAIESIVKRDVVLDAPRRESGVVGRTNRNTSQYPDVEERLRNALGTKVTINKRNKGGSIELHFFSDEELDRLVQFLVSSRG